MKIIAASYGCLCSASIAADVTLSGSQEFNYQDNNGTTPLKSTAFSRLELLRKREWLDVSAVIKRRRGWC